jgi:RNA recognition motif-containing protein
MFAGPTTDVQPKGAGDVKKFTGACRLYVGNVPSDLKEEDFVALFSPFGETSEPFMNHEKMFAFIKMVSKLQLSSFIYRVLNFLFSTGLSFECRTGEKCCGRKSCPRQNVESSLCSTRSYVEVEEPFALGF